MKKFALLLTFATLLIQPVIGQNDSVIFNNNNYIVGEVKTMNRGVVTIEADYSDSDFRIEWEKIKEIYTETFFLITTSEGDRYNGSLRTSEPGIITIMVEDGRELNINQNDIVWLDDVDQGFWSQLYASIDVGFDATKANNLRQLSTRITLGYLAKRWTLDGSYNTLFSTQNEVEDIRRTDGGIGFKYFLPKDWYPEVSLSFLSNTEQLLDLRATTKVGLGKFLIHTNNSYWGIALGINNNNEIFASETPDRNSWEGYFGSELNLFDIGDLSMATKLIVYPSLTESGRWRTDFNLDTKYEMPFDDDFYIKLGLTYNFDNKPIEEASKDDYVFYTGFGWEW